MTKTCLLQSTDAIASAPSAKISLRFWRSHCGLLNWQFVPLSGPGTICFSTHSPLVLGEVRKVLKALGGLCFQILFNVHAQKYLGSMVQGKEITWKSFLKNSCSSKIPCLLLLCVIACAWAEGLFWSPFIRCFPHTENYPSATTYYFLIQLQMKKWVQLLLLQWHFMGVVFPHTGKIKLFVRLNCNAYCFPLFWIMPKSSLPILWRPFCWGNDSSFQSKKWRKHSES